MSPEPDSVLRLQPKWRSPPFVSIATSIGGKTRRHRGSASGDAARLSWPVYVFLALDPTRLLFPRARGKPSIERCNRDRSNDLRTDCTTTLAVAQRVLALVVWLTTSWLSALSLDCIPSIRSHLVVFASCFFIGEAVLSRTNANDDACLVDLVIRPVW